MKRHNESAVVTRYFWQRYRLFARFGEGVLLDDDEAWFSVTPEIVARHTAERVLRALRKSAGLGCCMLFDPFCGAGGNAIQFAKAFNQDNNPGLVVCCDVDPHKAALTAHNARVYGVRDRLEIVVGDFMQMSKHRMFNRAIDAVFLSPPWGGPSHARQRSDNSVFSLHSMSPDGKAVFQAARQISPAIAFYLPRHTDAHELATLDSHCEIETNFFNGKPRTITAYFGPLILT